jgi:DNA-binding MarR family transcriptional regulator
LLRPYRGALPVTSQPSFPGEDEPSGADGGEVAGEERLEPLGALRALTRLERRGWVRPLPADDRRRPYEITEPGRAVLAGQLRSMARIVAVGHRRIAPA